MEHHIKHAAANDGALCRNMSSVNPEARHVSSFKQPDVYLVATKTITQSELVPIILSGGVRGTNAELWGMGGQHSKLPGARLRCRWLRI